LPKSDLRNSFPAADQRALREMREPLVITVHLAPEDPRYIDLKRNMLSKLERAMPRVTLRLACCATRRGAEPRPERENRADRPRWLGKGDAECTVACDINKDGHFRASNRCIF
jgi:hypothetical protein